MSKMPAKKKSCFQITSVTQAQASANNATDDTESLDDPDESRTEDVSSEIFDVSRTDCEPGVCGRSSSEETLNNVSESEGQLANTAPLNGGLGQRNLGTVGASQVTNASSIGTISSCSSRFRVIKLDHGTGEPFKRGRWTCTEYYEKDPEGSVMGRTVDSIRHPSVTEPPADRDSGIGATIGSIMTPVTNDLSSGGLSFTGHLLEAHSFNVSGSPESFSNKSVPPSAQQVPGSAHVAAPHNLHPDAGHPGALLKSPSVPPPQVQPLVYPTQPVPPYPPIQPALIPAQPEYIQCTMPITVTQTHPGASLSTGHVVSQGAPTIPTLSTGGMQLLGSVEIPGSVNLVSHPVSTVSNLVQHPSLGLLGTSVNSVQQHPVTQYQASGALLGLSTSQNTQNVLGIPVTLAGAGIPASSILAAVSGSAAVPSLNTSVLSQVSQVPRNGTAAGVGNPGGAFSQVDESQRMPDASALVHAKDMMKPFITEGLQLPSPAVNTLFGIPISIDGEEDRNPSTAFFQAFQSKPGSRLKDSKMTCDSASGASVVAIDNKIEQAMDLVKSHLMYAVREEVEVLKEQIKELFERNSVLERENAVLKSLANNDQLSQLPVQSSPIPSAAPAPPQTQNAAPQAQSQPYPPLDSNAEAPPQPPQPNVSSA